MNDILDIKYSKHILTNGLEVILHKDNSLPLTAVNLWYKVGSANEVEGKAGGSLNGSTSIDRTNYYETVPSNFLEMALWLNPTEWVFCSPPSLRKNLQVKKML